jgi:arylsulfatase A
MNSRNHSTPFLQSAATFLQLAVVSLAFLTFAGQAAELPTTTKPNIIYILADDLGYGDVGVYNPQSKIPTPNLDRLAAQGMRFADAHAPNAVCTPTRYALLTGRYAFRSRLQSLVIPPWGPPLIEDSRLTVPALLKDHGYATACIGKWHLGWNWPTKDGQPPSSKDGLSNVDFTKPIGGGPITSGFDSYFGVDVPNFPPYCFIENERTIEIPSLVAPRQKGGFNHPGPMVAGWNLTNIMPELTKRAVQYIEDAAAITPNTPFFLYFPVTAPHYPVVPSAEFKGRSQAGDYGDFVAQVDAMVGEVMTALDRTGFAKNTLIIFTSDNGPEVTGEVSIGVYDRINEHGHRSMGDLRGVKRDVWEGGHRVPFIARWPDHIPAGAVSEEVISQVDLMATCAALLGSKLPSTAAEDSYSILPALLGQKLATPIRKATVFHGARGSLAIRQGDWVLIDARTGAGSREPAWFKEKHGYPTNKFSGELFNLRDDLAQRKNLYGEKPEVVQRLKALLEKYKTEGRSAPVAKLPSAAPQKIPGEPRIYKTVGDRELKLFIVKPDDWKAADQRPGLVLFHGGGWTGGSPAVLGPQAEYFASRGMVCALVEYRLLKDKPGAPPTDCIQDAKSAMRWVRSHARELGIDPQRIGAAGGSAGGHLAAFTGLGEGLDDPADDLKVSPKPAALVLFNPVFNNGPGQYGHGRVGDRFKEFSPAHNITSNAPPAIVFLGTQDRLITVKTVEEFKTDMANVGVRCEARFYEGAGHGFFNREPYRSLTLIEADKFLSSLGWLRGEPTIHPPK